jgi:hypothetical protein
MKRILVVVPVAMLLAAGCRNRLVFATHTSLGLDVSGTAQVPNKVSLSYNRFEAAIVPRKTNGEAHSVYGGMDADVKFFEGHTIKQTFATGKAAMNATGADEPLDETPSKTITEDHPLVFATGTTFGLHLAAGEGEIKPSLLLGYRREEGVTIPVPDPALEARSVYADLLINSSTRSNSITTNFSALNGVLIKQSFATGRAAEQLALGEDARAKLKAAAGVEATSKNLRMLKARSEGIATDIRTELDRLEDAQLPQAVDEFRKVGFISEDEASALKQAENFPPRKLCRKLKELVQRQTEGEFQSKETVKELQEYLEALRKIH